MTLKSILSKACLLTAFVTASLAHGAAAADDKVLYLFNWADYTAPDLIKRFSAETGIKVIIDTYDSNGALLAKLEGGAGGYDVAAPSQTTLKGLIDAGALLKFDAKTLPNFKNVAAPFDSIDSDPGRQYSIPYTWGMDSFAYNSAKVPGGKLDDSWKSLFDPAPDMVGKISMVKPDALYYAAALYLGVERCTENPEDAKKILDVLQKQKVAVKTYVENGGAREQLANGEVAAAMIGNGSYHRALKDASSLVFVYPKEGVSVWYDNFVIPAKAPHVENAKIFLNWMMDPKNAAEAANYTSDNVSIRGAGPFLKPELRDDPAVNVPDNMSDRLKPMAQCSAKANDLRGRVWASLAR
ncbi:extracellular solute-binding protein [Rhizobium sp. BK376]|uniref:extracellular solute-binding protein n=1 Tax=Rhizobium sp. BK376 TaxID=2512149 RepID=UPI001046D404|nr:extracellular solute-binding protein [Rhizobium sp. BK376]TCR71769.1 spermidine/putrescine transport system substrate-binding protein [Rhizobium sp. BK376]